MSPDASSSLFPERPIRPLPKRRLRERLSPDVATSIRYPPTPQPNPPLFVYPYSPKEDSASLVAETAGVVSRENGAKLGQEPGLRRDGLEVGQNDESLIGQARRALGSRGFRDSLGRPNGTLQTAGQGRQSHPQPPPSTASSADGYDSFENTNNKKKRKIPTAGEAMLHGTHPLNDSSALGVPSPPTTSDEGGDAPAATTHPYSYQSGTFPTTGQGISGPGRGRIGRTRNGRSPLRTLTDPNSNWTSRAPKPRPNAQHPSGTPADNTGIISTAIASAEKLPTPQGQENISLLHHQASAKSSPASSTQFTFTFGSQNSVSWPGSDPVLSGTRDLTRPHRPPSTADHRDPYQGNIGRASQATSVPGLGYNTSAHPGAALGVDEATRGATAASTIPKKPKRRGNPLLRAAMQRRKETELQNTLHPPTAEEYWMCEFCEYNEIFGQQPVALIRHYELKDLQRTREEKKRRRLLEKAKMKSRKSKKTNKPPGKNNGGASDRNHGSTADQHGTGNSAPEVVEPESEGSLSIGPDDELPALVPHEGPAEPSPMPPLSEATNPGGEGESKSTS